MTGTWYFWFTYLDSVHVVAYTKDFNFWWVLSDFDATLFENFRLSTNLGEDWNSYMWTRTLPEIDDWTTGVQTFLPFKGTLGMPPAPAPDTIRSQ